jgi:hypothetical protein
MTPQQMQHLALESSGLWDRLRWRLCWLLMPAIGLAKEKRRLEEVAMAAGTSRAVSKRIASEYFNTLRDKR